MADLIDELLEVAALALTAPTPAAGRVILAFGIPLALAGVQYDEIPGMSNRDLFEEWLIERWRGQTKSVEFRESSEYNYLVAQWEREQ